MKLLEREPEWRDWSSFRVVFMSDLSSNNLRRAKRVRSKVKHTEQFTYN